MKNNILTRITQAKSTLDFSNLWNEGISNVGEWTCVANNIYGYIKSKPANVYISC